MESTIGSSAYQHNRVNQWTSGVVETSLNQLTKLGKPFKYIGKSFYYTVCFDVKVTKTPEHLMVDGTELMALV